MKGAARFLFGAALGVALGYAYVLLTQRSAPQKSPDWLTARRQEPARTKQPEQREPAEEIAAS